MGGTTVTAPPARRHVAISAAVPASRRDGRPSPDRQQPRTGVEVTRPALGETHGELRAISVKDVVGGTDVVSGEVNLGRARQAALEPSYPLLAGRGHQSANELVDRQWEDDVKLAGSLQQRLGPKDVSPVREVAVGDARRPSLELGGDRSSDRRNLSCRQSCPSLASVQEVTAVEHHPLDRPRGQAGLRPPPSGDTLSEAADGC